MNTLFISDLHLEPAHPGITRLFLDFLQNQAIHADALYILGDFFAAWLGDDDLTEFNQTIIQALKNLTDKGVPVYFMHGNRDFMIGHEFMRQTGCRLLADPTVINLYGLPTLLMHGDSLCTEDKAYLRFRRIARNSLYQKIAMYTPLAWRRAFAQGMRRPRAQPINKYIMDATPQEINRVMQQHNVTLLIHGHTHRPAIHNFDIDNQSVCRIVLSDWSDEMGSVLVCEADGEKYLEKIIKSEGRPPVAPTTINYPPI